MQIARKIVLFMIILVSLASILGPSPVRAANWSVGANPSSLTTREGSAPSLSTISVSNILVCCVDVDFLLNATSCCPSDLGLTFSSANGLPPGRLRIGIGGSASLILTIDTSRVSVAPGSNTNYGVTVYAWHCNDSNCTTFDGNPQTAGITVYVTQAFGVTANPASLDGVRSIQLGSSNPGISTVTLTSLNGFSGSVDLTSSVSTTPTSLNGISGNGAITSKLPFLPCGTCPPPRLSVSFSSTSVDLTSAPSGDSIMTVSTTSTTTPGMYTVTVTATSGSVMHSITVNVNIVDFSVTASSVSVNLAKGVSYTDNRGIRVRGLSGFTGMVSLSATSYPSGLNVVLNPQMVSLNLANQFFDTSALTLTSTSASSYTAIITGTGNGVTHSVTVTVNVGDFGVTADSSAISTNVGVAGTSGITVTAVYGFGGIVNLASTVSPKTGLTCTLTPTSVTGSGTSTLSCTATVSGMFTVTVTGTNGTLSHSATVTYSVAVPDFSITASPTSVTANAGVAGTSMITVSPINSFTGTVALTSSISPAGLTCALPASIALGVSQTSTLSCSGSAGLYTVTVTGTNRTLSRTVTVAYTVQDFSVSTSSPEVAAEAGFNATSLVTITSLNGFPGTIQMTTTISPGLTCSLGRIIPAPYAISRTLSCRSLSPGTFTVMVGGTSGSLAHTTVVTVTVTVDKTPPVITISSPSDGAVLTSTSVTVSGTASDNVAVDRVEISKDGNNWVPATGTMTLSDWHGSLTLSEGSNTLYARATDTSGNQAKLSIHVTVQTPPTIPPSGSSSTPSSSNPIIDFLTSNFIWLILAGVAVVLAAAILVLRKGKAAKLGK